MPSHLSTLGFEVKTEEDFKALAVQVAEQADAVAAEPGEYLLWAGSDGEELWVQLDEEGDIIGMNPHFSGKSRVRVGLEKRIRRDGATALDGAFRGWASPATDVPEDGDYPFVFDSPDAGTYSQLRLPGIAEVQIAAFALEIRHYDSPEAFSCSQNREVPLGSRSFIPSGLFTPDGVRKNPPQSQALFTGHVIEAATRENSLTGCEYFWALVDSFGGQFDVLIDRTLLPSGPVEGGVLSGQFWLSGRLLSYPRLNQGWFGGLLGGTKISPP
jgi:hypothetical protein